MISIQIPHGHSSYGPCSFTKVLLTDWWSPLNLMLFLHIYHFLFRDNAIKLNKCCDVQTWFSQHFVSNHINSGMFAQGLLCVNTKRRPWSGLIGYFIGWVNSREIRKNEDRMLGIIFEKEPFQPIIGSKPNLSSPPPRGPCLCPSTQYTLRGNISCPFFKV